jgi:hypothetical protein
MRDDTGMRVTRAIAALGAALSLQGCAQLQNIRVAPLRTENSSSYRSMLAEFNPLPYQHRSASDGALLRAPEDRGRRPFWYHY